MKFAICSLALLVAVAPVVHGWWFSSENNINAEEGKYYFILSVWTEE